jgi:hypothetical protein
MGPLTATGPLTSIPKPGTLVAPSGMGASVTARRSHGLGRVINGFGAGRGGGVTAPATWKGVRARFEGASPEVRGYFVHYPALLAGFPWDVSMGYMFTKLEQVHRLAIYCGVVKLHSVDGHLAWAAVDAWYMLRADFRRMFSVVFGVSLQDQTLTEAEKIRDRVLHGGSVSDADHRRGAVRLLEYADEFNAVVLNEGGFSPFGDLRGFKGRGTSLGKATSRLVLKGLGFAIG